MGRSLWMICGWFAEALRLGGSEPLSYLQEKGPAPLYHQNGAGHMATCYSELREWD